MNGEIHKREIDTERDLDYLICAAISPIRSFEYVHVYPAGSKKSIKEHISLFSVDLSNVGRALHKFHAEGAERLFML